MKRAFGAVLVCLGSLAAGSAMAETGRTPGRAAVSPSGAATYSIPLWTPPGIRGLTPSLAINYSSRSGPGLAGVGFEVAFGQSIITRCNQTIAQDGAASAATLTASDKFCLDGNRLRLTGGTYGAANSTYQTEVETFSKVIAKSSAGDGPQWFEVWGKNGLVMEYGHTADSRIESALTIGGQTATVRVWAINKVRDRAGNAINYTYIDDTANGSFRPDKITWAGNSNVPIADRYRVQFIYETPDRPDPIYSYLYGNASGVDGHVNEFKRLSRVDVFNDVPSAVVIRRYKLTWDAGGGISGRSRLQSIQECGGTAGSTCLAATTLAWQDGTPGFESPAAYSGYAMPAGVTPFIMDINGDGRDDAVWSSSTTSGSGTWRYMLTDAEGTYGSPVNTGIANTNFSAALPIEWNGDGQWDLLVPFSGSEEHAAGCHLADAHDRLRHAGLSELPARPGDHRAVEQHPESDLDLPVR